MSELKEIIDNIGVLEKVCSIKLREENFFSLGRKSYYENRISDLFHFFMRSDITKAWLAKALIKCLCEQKAKYDQDNKYEYTDFLYDEVDCEREINAKGKSIDIVLTGDNWIIAIENKTFTEVHNPLSIYKAHIEKICKDNEIEHPPMFCLLAPRKLSPSGEADKCWIPVTYGELAVSAWEIYGAEIKNAPHSKWHPFYQEFLGYLEIFGKESSMKDDDYKDIEKNYPMLNKAARQLPVMMDNFYKKYNEELKIKLYKSLDISFLDVYEWPEREKPRLRWLKNNEYIRFMYKSDDWGAEFTLNTILYYENFPYFNFFIMYRYSSADNRNEFVSKLEEYNDKSENQFTIEDKIRDNFIVFCNSVRFSKEFANKPDEEALLKNLKNVSLWIKDNFPQSRASLK